MLPTTTANHSKAKGLTLRFGAQLLALGMLAGTAAFGAGCTVEGQNPDESTDSSTEALTGNEKAAYEFFVNKGLKNYQAAGIVGNLIQESSVNPTVSQYGGGPGRGIAQWSAGGRWDSDGGDNAVWYAHTQGQSVYSLNLQLEFVWYELTHFSGYGLSELKGSSNIDGATIAFQDRFEGCGQCDESNRISYAKQVLSAYGNIQPGHAPSVNPPTACGKLTPGEGLKAGQHVMSCDNRFELIMQTDGNLVLYQSGHPLWASNTYHKGGEVAIMQGDGNLVVYTSTGQPVWASGTYNHHGSDLAIQDDGNVVVYDAGHPIWASNTSGH